MQDNLKLIWEGLVNAYDVGWELVLINLLWAVLCSPFIFILLVGLSNPNLLSSLLVFIALVGLLAFTSGLNYYTHGLAHGESYGWRDYFSGVKSYFWPGMRCLLANLVIIFVLVFYYQYFIALSNNLSPFVIGLIYGFALIWLLFSPFLLPLMIEQEKPTFRNAIRNTLVMYVKWPGTTLPAIIIFYFLVISSTFIFLPWIILTGSLSAFILSYVVRRKAEESMKLAQNQETGEPSS
jgi:hypothetical protein